MDVKLILQKSSSAKVFRMRSEETIIGRQSGSDLRIPSAAVSRRHCRLSFRDDFLSVEDLDSANGTFVNGERVQGLQVLRPGDELEVGPVSFRVEYQLTAAAIDRLLQEQGPAEAAAGAAADDIPEVEVEQVDSAAIETANLKAAKPKKDSSPPKAKKEAAKTREAKALPKKPARTQPVKKKPAAKKSQPVTGDEALDPDVAAMLDGEKSWHMPSGDDFRDFLTQMEDD